MKTKQSASVSETPWELRNGIAKRVVTYADGSKQIERMKADSLVELASVMDDSGTNETRVAPADSKNDGEAWEKLASWG